MTERASPNKLGIENATELELAEAALTLDRIAKLVVDPIAGRFGIEHLKAVHRYIFQDVYDHAGEFHSDEKVRTKIRKSEITGQKRVVFYPPISTAHQKLPALLSSVADIQTITQLPKQSFIKLVTDLYAGADYMHPFQEGNSRTLRIFTAQLARECGWKLDWGTTNANGVTRDILYAARDIAVLDRVKNDIKSEKQLFLASKAIFDLKGCTTLDQIIGASISSLSIGVDCSVCQASPCICEKNTITRYRIGM